MSAANVRWFALGSMFLCLGTAAFFAVTGFQLGVFVEIAVAALIAYLVFHKDAA
jgi:hypothetical protein